MRRHKLKYETSLALWSHLHITMCTVHSHQTSIRSAMPIQSDPLNLFTYLQFTVSIIQTKRKVKFSQ